MTGDAPLRSSAEEGPIEANVPPQKVKQEPYPLPNDFEWITVDIDDQEQVRRGNLQMAGDARILTGSHHSSRKCMICFRVITSRMSIRHCDSTTPLSSCIGEMDSKEEVLQ
jgi:hypothetical protein